MLPFGSKSKSLSKILTGMTDFAQLPALIIYIIGILYTTALLASILQTRNGFLRTDLGLWVTRLLAAILIGSVGVAIGLVGLVFYRDWFESTALANQSYGAFRLTVGILLSVGNFQIAMERYWLICKEEKVPRFIFVTIMGHAAVTIGLIVGCFFSKETLITRRPGGTWQPYVVLTCMLQYILLSFGGILVLYTKTYLHVCKVIVELQDIAHDQGSGSSELRLRVLKTCIMMTVAIFACYGIEAVVVLYSLATPDWKPSSWLDAFSDILVALDSIVSPLLVMEMHSSYVISDSLAGSILRSTQVSELRRDSMANPLLRTPQISGHRKSLAPRLSITGSVDSKE